jgi:hypothetical protein
MCFSRFPWGLAIRAYPISPITPGKVTAERRSGCDGVTPNGRADSPAAPTVSPRWRGRVRDENCRSETADWQCGLDAPAEIGFLTYGP